MIAKIDVNILTNRACFPCLSRYSRYSRIVNLGYVDRNVCVNATSRSTGAKHATFWQATCTFGCTIPFVQCSVRASRQNTVLVLVCPPKRYACYSLRSYADGLAIRTVVEVISLEITVISYREFIAGWFVYNTYRFSSVRVLSMG